METTDLIATIGVSLLLIAFFLQSFKIIEADSYAYILLNIVGAAIAGYASWLIPFLPFVILEGVWCMVAISSIIKIYRKRSFHVEHRPNKL